MLETDKRKINMEIYNKLILTIKKYFDGKDVQYTFLHGGCYWLAITLCQYIPDSVIVFNRKIQHCACLFNDGVYDIRGRIQSRGFFVATTEDMKYMQKHFVPTFDAEILGNHLNVVMNKKGKEDVVCGKMKVI